MRNGREIKMNYEGTCPSRARLRPESRVDLTRRPGQREKVETEPRVSLVPASYQPCDGTGPKDETRVE